MESYKEVKKEYDVLLRTEKGNKLKQHILNSDNKMKTLWRTVASIKNYKNTYREIPGNPTEMANKFNTYFATAAKEKNIQQKIYFFSMTLREIIITLISTRKQRKKL